MVLDEYFPACTGLRLEHPSDKTHPHTLAAALCAGASSYTHSPTHRVDESSLSVFSRLSTTLVDPRMSRPPGVPTIFQAAMFPGNDDKLKLVHIGMPWDFYGTRFSHVYVYKN